MCLMIFVPNFAKDKLECVDMRALTAIVEYKQQVTSIIQQSLDTSVLYPVCLLCKILKYSGLITIIPAYIIINDK